MDKQELEELRTLLIGLIITKRRFESERTVTNEQLAEWLDVPIAQIVILYQGDMNKLSMATIVAVSRYTGTKLRYSIVPTEDKGTDG